MCTFLCVYFHLSNYSDGVSFCLWICVFFNNNTKPREQSMKLDSCKHMPRPESNAVLSEVADRKLGEGKRGMTCNTCPWQDLNRGCTVVRAAAPGSLMKLIITSSIC